MQQSSFISALGYSLSIFKIQVCQRCSLDLQSCGKSAWRQGSMHSEVSEAAQTFIFAISALILNTFNNFHYQRGFSPHSTNPTVLDKTAELVKVILSPFIQLVFFIKSKIFGLLVCIYCSCQQCWCWILATWKFFYKSGLLAHIYELTIEIQL